MVAEKRKRRGKGKSIRRDRGSGRGQITTSSSLWGKISRISKLDRYERPRKLPGTAKLDSNENFVLSKNFICDAAAAAVKQVDLREYPIDELDVLYNKLESYSGISREYIAAGSGSDQIIELILSTVGRKRATVFTPTFSYFINRCKLHNTRVDEVPLRKDFTLDLDRFVKSARESDLVYICSPNNPTGNQFKRSIILEALDSIPSNTLVLIDEAYVEFADYSLVSEAIRRDNLVVLRTMSKAFGLAGARLGYMISNSRFADVFRSTIQSPYPISTMSLAAACSMLANAHVMRDSVKLIRSERSRMIDHLRAIKNIRTFDSDANFIFVSAGTRNYGAIARAFSEELITVKMLGDIAGYEGCFRITIGSSDLNDRVLRCAGQGATFSK